MTIEAYIALILYATMVFLLLKNIRKGIRWKSIVEYLKGFVALFLGLFLINFVLEYNDRPGHFRLVYSGWTYFFMFPLLIIYAYLLPIEKEYTPIKNLFRKEKSTGSN